ncbi:GNAT family N-acetyltransferase [Clostridium algoriphilum]|uniref:GNAT family N-acetyltransferase n=1 Tax=Clostridium algoriphilum TaxID=198347 RepID=UPI001CF55F1F|nr:GNAT family N-acetyltransferase [Clostridium algoriphilum]MCB2295384.1 GNAT family N-acetyltransferase [Clostridium algoriphilum]
MTIKKFKVLSNLKRKELYNFIKSKDLTYNKTYLEMIRTYESDIFNEGNNIFILFDKSQIKGSMAVITKEISIKGEAYVTDICIENEGVETSLCLLLKEIVDICNICSGRILKVGIRENEKQLIPYLKKIEFTHIYDVVVMNYKKGENMGLEVSNDMQLIALDILNSTEYLNIHNGAFESSPNGTAINEIEVKDYIVQYANNEDLIGISFVHNIPCGIYELSIHQNIGWIDTLGIAPSYQNKGLGKKLLAKCIKRLYEDELDEIKLLVITSNNIAATMYKRYGFKEEKVFSYWFEKPI